MVSTGSTHAGLESDLTVGESERRQAGGGVGLVPPAVGRLLSGRPVERAAVGLDHDAVVGCEEVDLVSVHVDAGQQVREARAARDRQEVALELRAGEREGPPVDDQLELGETRPPRGGLELGSQRFELDEFAQVGLVEGRFDLVAGKAGGEVDERGGGCRDRDAVVSGGVYVSAAVDPDAGGARA